jgi:hypothetical protein
MTRAAADLVRRHCDDRGDGMQPERRHGECDSGAGVEAA